MCLEGHRTRLALAEDRLGRVVLWRLLGVNLTGAAVLVTADLLDNKLARLLKKRLRGNLPLGCGALQLGIEVAGGLVGDQLLQDSGKRLTSALLGGGSGLSGSSGLGFRRCLNLKRPHSVS